jgi:hypothetical protein
MTTRTDLSDSPLIEGRDDLLSVFQKGEKPKADWRIGTEHEKFVYRLADHRAPSWDEPGGIRDLLMGLTEFGWSPVLRKAGRQGHRPDRQPTAPSASNPPASSSCRAPRSPPFTTPAPKPAATSSR